MSKVQFLRGLFPWKDFCKSDWLLYRDQSLSSKVLKKYASHKSYFFQEIKFVLKALSFVSLRKTSKISGDLAFVNSKNQHSAFQSLSDKISIQIIGFEYKNYNVKSLNLNLISFFYLVFFIITNFKNLRKLTHKKYHYHQLKALLYALIIIDEIDISNIKNVFIANDHHSYTRILLYFRTLNNFQIIYKQHAQVSSLFPPLDWDHAILDGDVAFEKYKNIGVVKSKIWISGNDKTESLISARGQFNFNKIGVAINSLDDVCQLIQYLNQLYDKHKIDSFLIRMHPSMKKNNHFVRNLSQGDMKFGIVFHTGDLSDFLSKVSICIAGASSVLLEAAIAKKLCVQHNFVAREHRDYYGFASEEMTISEVKLINLDRTKTNWEKLIEIQTKNARRFSATLGTSYEGKEVDNFLPAKFVSLTKV